MFFCWVPSHIGIKGNEIADKFAKEALTLNVCESIKIPYTDYFPAVRKYIYEQWQQKWDTLVDNKLHSVKPIISSYVPFNLTRRDEVVLHRCRIGHSYVTHSHLLKSEEAPHCIPCHCLYTVKHILIDCVDFNFVRNKYYRVSSLKELFESVDPVKIIGFLKEIHLYYKI